MARDTMTVPREVLGALLLLLSLTGCIGDGKQPPAGEPQAGNINCTIDVMPIRFAPTDTCASIPLLTGDPAL